MEIDRQQRYRGTCIPECPRLPIFTPMSDTAQNFFVSSLLVCITARLSVVIGDEIIASLRSRLDTEQGGALAQSENQLLNALDPKAFKHISPLLNSVELVYGQELAYPHQSVHRVYFPHSGIISCVVELPGGGAIETAMLGKDGQWGAGPSYGRQGLP